MADIMVDVFATPELTSLLLPSVVGNNLTSLRVEFFGTVTHVLLQTIDYRQLRKYDKTQYASRRVLDTVHRI